MGIVLGLLTLEVGQIVLAFLKEPIFKVYKLLVPLLELSQFEIPLGELESLRFRGGNIPFNTSSQMLKFIFHLLDLSSRTILFYQKLLEFNLGASLGSGFLFVLSAFSMLAACASRAVVILSATRCLMEA
uniref:Uncharacterized protein n=1 Tax=Tanacetum cinerariifolium TaxID=118510 RepID=A0A699IVI6_TANCI|nr:hypothetical protein [Tanacetum cinerariifolium]